MFNLYIVFICINEERSRSTIACIDVLYIMCYDRPSENKIVQETFRLAQIKSSIYGFHLGTSDKKIVEAACKRRGTFIRISVVTFARERAGRKFQFSTWVWKGSREHFRQPVRHIFISVSWDGEADLALIRPPLSSVNPVTAANKQERNVNGSFYTLKCRQIFRHRRDYVDINRLDFYITTSLDYRSAEFMKWDERWIRASIRKPNRSLRLEN